MSERAVQTVLPLDQDPGEPGTGVWPAQRLKAAMETRMIKAEEAISDKQIQPASLDLRLGHFAYQVPASFLPGPNTKVRDRLDFLSTRKISIENGEILKTGNVYIIQLLENLRLKKRISGIANPKSSTGRLDVFARLITDYGVEFDRIPEKYSGPLWLEVAPRSFDVMVRTGSRLAQIRIKHGSPPSSQTSVRRLDKEIGLVRAGDKPADIKGGAIALSVDIMGDPVSGIIGYKAKATSEYIDIDKVDHYDVDVFWEKICRPDRDGPRRDGIVLEVDDFYILKTKEKVVVPSDWAADMIAYDTLVGEFRTHYAGFFDPGFGYIGSKAVGTPIILEVRSHEVPFMVEDGQIVGRVLWERLSEETERPYGSDIGSSYQNQELTLSKQFKR